MNRLVNRKIDRKLSETTQNAIFSELQDRPENKICSDCGVKQPTWVSVDFGVFVCMRCSGAHRSLGQNITRVRSTQLDYSWTPPMIQILNRTGNQIANDYWEYQMPKNFKKPDSMSSQEDIQRFVVQKYIEKRFTPKGFVDPVTEYKNSDQYKNDLKTSQELKISVENKNQETKQKDVKQEKNWVQYYQNNNNNSKATQNQKDIKKPVQNNNKPKQNPQQPESKRFSQDLLSFTPSNNNPNDLNRLSFDQFEQAETNQNCNQLIANSITQINENNINKEINFQQQMNDIWMNPGSLQQQPVQNSINFQKNTSEINVLNLYQENQSPQEKLEQLSKQKQQQEKQNLYEKAFFESSKNPYSQAQQNYFASHQYSMGQGLGSNQFTQAPTQFNQYGQNNFQTNNFQAPPVTNTTQQQRQQINSEQLLKMYNNQ